MEVRDRTGQEYKDHVGFLEFNNESTPGFCHRGLAELNLAGFSYFYMCKPSLHKYINLTSVFRVYVCVPASPGDVCLKNNDIAEI